ncbi:15918_t:CDS:2 [Gigaspora margarita]|uniref:15918_t:CDS:1 n=1 Tax=Gigaspora margarita TaxID=4874 RepID=A0ABN7VB77_GIGMA|nr:15918_t:CDS:2 [Gigaspora margarita]
MSQDGCDKSGTSMKFIGKLWNQNSELSFGAQRNRCLTAEFRAWSVLDNFSFSGGSEK